MSRYSNDIMQRQRERTRAVDEARQRQEDDREAKKRSERSEQDLNTRLIAIREQISSVEDLRLDLQRRKLLVYADLTRLKERERFLLKRLAGITNIADLETGALRSEIAEYNRLYNEFMIGFHEQSTSATFELAKKQNRLIDTLQMTSKEIAVLNRIIEELLADNNVNLWFSQTLNQYTAQLRDLTALLRNVKTDPDYLLSSLFLLERIRKRVRRIRQNCDGFKDKAEKLDPRRVEPEDFLYLEPFYFRKPKERIPSRILTKIQALERFSKP